MNARDAVGDTRQASGSRRFGSISGLGGSIAILVVLTSASVCPAGAVARPTILHYAGFLADADGHPVADGSRTMTFRIWDAETGGQVLWKESQDIKTEGGDYSVNLGLETPLSLPPQESWWLSIQEGGSERSPRIALRNTAYAFNSDMVDGYHASNSAVLWGGSGYWDCLFLKRGFQIGSDTGEGFGPADLYIPIPHWTPFRIVLTCAHAVPEVGDVASAECVENDGVVAILGVDGSGEQVRSSLRLSSTDRILGVKGGHITLSCPGDGSRRVKLHTQGEWALGYITW